MKNNKYKSLLTINRESIIPSIFIAFTILLGFNPLNNIEVDSFANREIGSGMMNNIDVVSRIGNIIKIDFIIAPFLLLLVYFVISAIINSSIKENYECVKLINIVSIISLSILLFSSIGKFASAKPSTIANVVSLMIVIALLSFLVLDKIKLKLDFRKFKWIFTASIPVTYLLGILFYKYTGGISVAKIVLIYIIIFILLLAIVKVSNKLINFNGLSKAYIVIMIAPIIVILANELCNILNQHSIIINSKLNVTIMIYGVLALIFIGYYIWIKRRNRYQLDFCFEKYYYPLTILTFSLLDTKLPFKMIVESDFFEQANHGYSIHSILQNGSIPIVENFDAHMLQNQIGNVLYGLFNNDSIGAIFVGYSVTPIIVILSYFMFTKLFTRDESFILMILLPIMADRTFYIFPLLPLIVMAFLYAYKKRSYLGYILFWSTMAIAALFRLDMTFSLAFASLITWIIIWILDKENRKIKENILSCIGIVGVCLVLFCGVCIIKDINPIERILEALSIIKSDINWGYSSIGDAFNTNFAINYYIIPVAVIGMIAVLVYKKYHNKELCSNNKIIIALILGLSFMFNFQRGILRHSVVEGTNSFVLSSSILFLAISIYLVAKKDKLIKFVLSYTIISIIVNMSMSTTLSHNSVNPLVSTSIKNYINLEEYDMTYTEKEDRVVLTENMKKIYKPIKEVFDNILGENETYLDFTNQTLLYSLVEREKPVYINQSPGLLNGEFTQQKFINQVKESEKEVSLVLMPVGVGILNSSMDGIANSYRYYLVSEFIFNNYEPLFRNESFAVWCKKDTFLDKKDLLLEYIESNKQYSRDFALIGYNYLEVEDHIYDLGNIPYVWANYDEIPITEKEVQMDVEVNSIYDFNDIDKTHGNYLYLNISSDIEDEVIIKLGKQTEEEFSSLIELKSLVRIGDNQSYLIRVSSDFNWYSGEINSIIIEENKDITVNKVQLLKGDTLKS